MGVFAVNAAPFAVEIGIAFDTHRHFYIIPRPRVNALSLLAGIAQLVEHHLAKVEVASSSLVSRSNLSLLLEL